MPRTVVGPLISLVALLFVAVVGGWINTVQANGRVVDDWRGRPIAGAEIQFGKRTVSSDDQGNFNLGLVPRDAKLSAVKRASGYGTTQFTADQHEVRLTPAVLSLQVNDAQSGKGVPSPQARQGTTVLQTGTDTGSLAIAPHPGKDVTFSVCAKDYQTIEVSSEDVEMVVAMNPQKGADCPPLPNAAPPPSPSSSPSESPAPSASGSPSPSPTASPSKSP